MKREEYREVYLRSDHWRDVRRDALQRAGDRCQVCNNSGQLDVHHRTYERLGQEDPTDLTVLCRRCHELFHSERRVAPARRPKVAPDNWSRLDEDARQELCNELLALLRKAPKKGMTPKQMAQVTGRRTQVIGSCMVALRKRGVVKQAQKRWRLPGTVGVYDQDEVLRRAEAWVVAINKRRAA